MGRSETELNKKNKAQIPAKTEDFAGFFKVFAGVSALLAALAAGLVILFDPLYHFHGPLPGMKAVLTDKEYQIPGSLRNFDYDAVIAGSSMTENSDNALYDELFGVKSVKAVRSSGSTADLCWYLDLAFESRDVRAVFYSQDLFALDAPCQISFKETGCPMYLYGRNPLNDVKYLLNGDVLFEKIPYLIAANTLQDYDEGHSYSWAKGKAFSKEDVLVRYERSEQQPMQDAGGAAGRAGENIDLLVQTVREHQGTRFVFFLPPYSAIYWDKLLREGLLDVYLEEQKLAMQALLKEPNAEIYCYQDDVSVITDLDLYCDAMHFLPEINDEIARRIARGEGRVSLKEAEAMPQKMKELTDLLEKTLIEELF